MKQNPNLLCTFIDANGTLLSCNHSFLEAVGFSSQHSLTGKNLYEILHAWEVEKIIQAIDSCKTNPDQTVTIEIKKTAAKTETYFRWTIYAGTADSGLAGIHLVGKNIDKEKQAEKDSLYQASLLEYISDAVISTNRHFIIKSWNKAAGNLYGVKAADAIGKPLPEVAGYEYPGTVKAVLQNEEQWKGCFRYKKENGVTLLVESCVTPVRNEANEVTGYVVVNRDITHNLRQEEPLQNFYPGFSTGNEEFQLLNKGAETGKKHTEEKLHQSRLLFEHFMGNAPLAAWIIDEDGTLQYISPEFQRKFGSAAGENDGKKNVFELFPANVAQIYLDNNRQVIKSGKAMAKMEKVRLPGGTSRICKIYMFPIKLKGLTLCGGWAVDMTEQMELQEQLTKSIERYEYANEATSDAIYEWDLVTGKMFKGKKFESLFHQSTESTNVRYDLIHPEDRKRVEKTVEDSIGNPDVDKWQIEYRYKVNGGKYRNVISKSSVIRENGKAVKVIGAVQDVTEQKMLQRRLVEQEKKIKREIVKSIIETQEKERRQLSVNLHDNVNQMLASCKLMLEMARENKENAPALTEKSYHGLQTVITEIRKISHDLNPFYIDDIGLTEAVSEMVEKTNLSGKVNVVFHHHDFIHQPFRPTDKKAVYRIIQEQLNNILKHARAENAVIRLSSGPEKIYLTVEDDGTGFNPESVKRGLGLKNIFHRVEYYNGKMRMESKPGAGCKMKILLNIDGKKTI